MNKILFPKIFHLLLPVFWVIALVFLTGCSGDADSLSAPTLAVDAEAATTAESNSTPASVAVNDCDQPGQVQTFEIASDLLNDQLRFSVYLPPCHTSHGQDTYPTLYLLHGQSFDDRQWLDLGVAEIADQLINSGSTIPFLIVMPNERYHYRSPANNAFPKAIVQELLPWVEAQLGARSGREWRAIGGISRGASWAVRLGLQDTSTFGGVGAHSLPTFNDDVEDLPDWLVAIPKGQAPRIYIDTGRSDPEVERATEFAHILNQYGIANEWHLNNGRHEESYWRAHVQEYLVWYSLPWRVQTNP